MGICLVLLLLICSSAYVRASTLRRDAEGRVTSYLDAHKGGLRGTAWKLARIGERCSPYISVACVGMAFALLFLR